MGRYVFKLPDVGEGTAEAEIVAWHVTVGDSVEEDQPLVDVMTDKATVEMTSPVAGVVIALHGEPGEMAAVGSPLVELEVEGASDMCAAKVMRHGREAKSMRHPSRIEAGARGEKPQPRNLVAPSAFATRTPADKPLASPAVRQRAQESRHRTAIRAGHGSGGTYQPC